MSNKLEQIQNWKAPKWHEDFGNPVIELELLKELCRFIIAENSDYNLELDCFEDGYMQVNMFLGTTKKFDLQVVDSTLPKIGLFGANGDEYYITSISDVRQYLK